MDKILQPEAPRVGSIQTNSLVNVSNIIFLSTSKTFFLVGPQVAISRQNWDERESSFLGWLLSVCTKETKQDLGLQCQTPVRLSFNQLYIQVFKKLGEGSPSCSCYLEK